MAFLPSGDIRRSMRAMRRAYARVVLENNAWGLPFIQWCEGRGIVEVTSEQVARSDLGPEGIGRTTNGRSSEKVR